MASEMDLNDYNKHRGMVRWFRPQVLLDAARRAIISALFGEYADGRLIQAALDPVTDDSDFKKRFTPGEGKDGITPVIENPAGETWISFLTMSVFVNSGSIERHMRFLGEGGGECVDFV